MKNLGPYRTKPNGVVQYVGNRLFPPGDTGKMKITLRQLEKRYADISTSPRWYHLTCIHAEIFRAVTDYFNALGALFIPLPLTTRMISSPGGLYGTGKLDYTTDTCPISLKWFEHPDEVYLAESSQIYLELALVQHNVDQVFSVYNSFRKEPADRTHLSEFHHIEYEGHVPFERNTAIAESCISNMLVRLLEKAEESVSNFLSPAQLKSLQDTASRGQLFQRASLKECYEALYEDSGDVQYLEFTLQGRFGTWQEIRLTEIFDSPLAITGYPLLEVPFYHAMQERSDPPCALNVDLIWAGYTEILGAGRRIASVEELEKKAEIFNLPRQDYDPYLRTRNIPHYRATSGFGLGWERFVQGILCLPTIWEACLFPRTHLGVIP